MKRTLTITLIILTLLLTACVPQQEAPESIPILCDKPFIEYKGACCEDQNNNEKCDHLEAKQEESAPVQEAPTEADKESIPRVVDCDAVAKEEGREYVEVTIEVKDRKTRLTLDNYDISVGGSSRAAGDTFNEKFYVADDKTSFCAGFDWRYGIAVDKPGYISKTVTIKGPSANQPTSTKTIVLMDPEGSISKY